MRGGGIGGIGGIGGMTTPSGKRLRTTEWGERERHIWEKEREKEREKEGELEMELENELEMELEGEEQRKGKGKEEKEREREREREKGITPQHVSGRQKAVTFINQKLGINLAKVCISMFPSTVCACLYACVCMRVFLKLSSLFYLLYLQIRSTYFQFSNLKFNTLDFK